MMISDKIKYYFLSMVVALCFWGIFLLLNFNYINIIFFLTAFIWHFSLQAPGVKEMALRKQNRFSLFSVVVRVNYYLQMFIHFDKFPYTASCVRALSPLVFTFFLLVMGGGGDLLFTILGSLVFEVLYLKFLKKPNLVTGHKDDQEIPPAIPNAEKSHE